VALLESCVQSVAFLIWQEISLLTLQVSAFLAVAFVLGIMAWIGYTLATTPPSEPYRRN